MRTFLARCQTCGTYNRLLVENERQALSMLKSLWTCWSGKHPPKTNMLLESDPPFEVTDAQFMNAKP